METDSTTDAAATQDDGTKATTTATETTDASTESGTDTNKGGDNSDTSTTTDDASQGAEDSSSSAPKFDTDLDEWADKTNRAKPETDRERELYQEIRNGQREFSRSKQAKDATQSIDTAIEKAAPADNKSDDGDDEDEDPLAKDVADLKRQNFEERSLRLRGEFFTEKSVTPEQSDMMGKILQEKVDKATTPAAKKTAFEFWTHPEQLEDWHALAKARLNNTGQDTTVVEEEAARKERERIAKESQASGGTRSAQKSADTKPKGYNRAEFLKSDD